MTTSQIILQPYAEPTKSCSRLFGPNFCVNSTNFSIAIWCVFSKFRDPSILVSKSLYLKDVMCVFSADPMSAAKKIVEINFWQVSEVLTIFKMSVFMALIIPCLGSALMSFAVSTSFDSHCLPSISTRRFESFRIARSCRFHSRAVVNDGKSFFSWIARESRIISSINWLVYFFPEKYQLNPSWKPKCCFLGLFI